MYYLEISLLGARNMTGEERGVGGGGENLGLCN